VSIVWRVLFLEHQPSFQHRQLVPWRIFETSTFTCLCVVLFFVFNLFKLSFPDASVSVSVSLEQFYPSLFLNPLSPFDLRSFWYPSRVLVTESIHFVPTSIRGYESIRSSIDTAIDTDLPFDYNPFFCYLILLPDTRIGFRCRIHQSSKKFQVFQVNSSFFTVLFTGKVQFGGENPILQFSRLAIA
jgi:hypothetical protein